MTTERKERVSPASLMWGIFWRSVGQHTTALSFDPLLATGSA